MAPSLNGQIVLFPEGNGFIQHPAHHTDHQTQKAHYHKHEDQRIVDRGCGQTHQADAGTAILHPPYPADIFPQEHLLFQKTAQQPIHLPQGKGHDNCADIKGHGNGKAFTVSQCPDGGVPIQELRHGQHQNCQNQRNAAGCTAGYQGEIDFKELAKNDIDFCFIKATEGSSFVDKKFAQNYTNAQKTNLYIGAYHFFSFESSGKQQADHFIKNVGTINNMLPPVVDLEFYGDYFKNKPSKQDVQKELNDFLSAIYKHYKKTPIIYATKESYDDYLSGEYKEYDIWIRNVINYPSLSDEKKWTFWQYTNRARLNGYSGREKYIDVNVFNGTKEEFLEKYAK